jgi:PST family polysaccharide transporter
VSRPFSIGKLSPTSWVTIQTVYTQAFAVAVFALQAPLLGPRAFGLIAIVMVFITFCEAFLETATEVLISVRHVDSLHYATVNGIMALLGTGLGLALAIAAGPIAWWFGEPQLAAIGRTMAILPLLSGLGCAPNAATKRQMEFKPLAIRMISGVTCGGIAGVVLTILGAGVWALVWQALLQRAICLAVLWRNSPLSLQLALSRPHWREMSVFAWPLLLARIMSWSASQLPRFILAMNLTVEGLGLFSLAARLSDIVVQATVVPRSVVGRVELRQFGVGSAGLDAAVSRLLRWMSALCFPLCFGGAVLAPTLIHAWLNTKWFDAIVPAQVLLLSSCTWVTFYGGGALFLALNQQRSEALVSILQTVTIVLAALGFGAYGLTAVTVALAIRPLLLIPLETTLVRRKCHVSTRAFLGSQGYALCAAAGSGLLVVLIRDRVEAMLGSRLALVMLTVAGFSIYALLLAVLAPQMLRQLLPRSQAQV